MSTPRVVIVLEIGIADVETEIVVDNKLSVWDILNFASFFNKK